MRFLILAVVVLLIIISGCIGIPNTENDTFSEGNVSANDSVNETIYDNETVDEHKLVVKMFYDSRQKRYFELPENKKEIPKNDTSSCASFVSATINDIIRNRTDNEIPRTTGVGIYKRNNTSYISVHLVVTDEIESEVNEMERELVDALPDMVVLETRYMNNNYRCSVDVNYDGRSQPIVPT